MSRNDWEAGTIYIPTRAWSKLKKSIQNAQNKEREIVFNKAILLQDKIKENFKGKKGIDVIDVQVFIEESVDDFIIESIVKLSLKNSGYQMKKITQKMLEEFVPKATNRTTHYGDIVSSDLSFDNENKTVSWYVGENNHAVEDARNSWLGKALFDSLRKIDFGNNKNFGGTIIGNDENNRDDGDGMNYSKEQFGKRVTSNH